MERFVRIVPVDMYLFGCRFVRIEFDFLPDYRGCRYVYGIDVIEYDR